MFDLDTGILAFVEDYDTNEAYQEWLLPLDTPLFAGRKNQRYIVPRTNQRFKIAVLTPPAFDFKGAPHVKVSLNVDNGTVRKHHILCSTLPSQRHMVEISTFTKRVEGELKSFGLALGEAKPLDDVELTSEQENIELATRGKIAITVQRGQVGRKKKTYRPSRLRVLPDYTSKAVAVDNGQSHSLKPIELEIQPPSDIPKRKREEFKAAEGVDGKAVEFTFFYRSQMFLEIKKVIPIIVAPNVTMNLVSHLSPAPQPKRKIIELNQDGDDEEPLQQKKVKTEPVDDTTALTAAQKLHGQYETEVQTEDHQLAPQSAVTSAQTKAAPSAPEAGADTSALTVSKSSDWQTETATQTEDREPESLDAAAQIQSNTDLPVLEASASDRKQTDKAKKKAALLLKLEENKIRQQLMELDIEEG